MRRDGGIGIDTQSDTLLLVWGKSAYSKGFTMYCKLEKVLPGL